MTHSHRDKNRQDKNGEELRDEVFALAELCLCDADAEAFRLEHLLQNEPAALGHYADYVVQSAALRALPAHGDKIDILSIPSALWEDRTSAVASSGHADASLDVTPVEMKGELHEAIKGSKESTTSKGAAVSRREASIEQAGGAEVELPLRRAMPRQWFTWAVIKERPIMSSFLMSAVVLLIGLTIMAVWRIPHFGRSNIVHKPGEVDAEHSADRLPARVAHATDASDAKGGIYALNEVIPCGKWHHLASGWLELETALGARISIEAPASFVLERSNRLRLAMGRITALVPSNAVGLVVATPTANVVDRGTEFGVMVGGKRSAEIHVFTGRVDVTPVRRRSVAHANAAVGTLELKADMAVRVLADDLTGSANSGVERIDVNHQLFSLDWKREGSRRSAREIVSVDRYRYSSDIQPSSRTPYYQDLSHRKLVSEEVIDSDLASDHWVGFADLPELHGDSGEPRLYDSGQPQPQIDFRLSPFEADRRLDYVEIVYFVYHIWSIHAPDELRVFASDSEDFENPRQLAVAKNFNDEDYTGNNRSNWRCIRRLRVPLEGADARFIRLDFRNKHKWTFLGNVRFFFTHPEEQHPQSDQQ